MRSWYCVFSSCNTSLTSSVIAQPAHMSELSWNHVRPWASVMNLLRLVSAGPPDALMASLLSGASAIAARGARAGGGGAAGRWA